jgi:hypothetical protein
MKFLNTLQAQGGINLETTTDFVFDEVSQGFLFFDNNVANDSFSDKGFVHPELKIKLFNHPNTEGELPPWKKQFSYLLTSYTTPDVDVRGNVVVGGVLKKDAGFAIKTTAVAELLELRRSDLQDGRITGAQITPIYDSELVSKLWVERKLGSVRLKALSATSFLDSKAHVSASDTVLPDPIADYVFKGDGLTPTSLLDVVQTAIKNEHGNPTGGKLDVTIRNKDKIIYVTSASKFYTITSVTLGGTSATDMGTAEKAVTDAATALSAANKLVLASGKALAAAQATLDAAEADWEHPDAITSSSTALGLAHAAHNGNLSAKETARVALKTAEDALAALVAAVTVTAVTIKDYVQQLVLTSANYAVSVFKESINSKYEPAFTVTTEAQRTDCSLNGKKTFFFSTAVSATNKDIGRVVKQAITTGTGVNTVTTVTYWVYEYVPVNGATPAKMDWTPVTPQKSWRQVFPDVEFVGAGRDWMIQLGFATPLATGDEFIVSYAG